MDETTKQICLEIQAEIRETYKVDIELEQIHRIILHQTLMIRESVEIMGNIRLPLLGNFKVVSRSIEREYARGVLTTNKETNLFQMLKSMK